ncbi:MAG: FHA domain-containing protein [Anaerolineae bacterium]|nr:FHA domain-containing protein [Anaerolineae bacterium]
MRFEALAERLVEGTFARLFAGQVSPFEVATHLTRAMEDHQVVSPDGKPQAPTHYWVYLPPNDCDALAIAQPALEEELAHHVVELATQANLELAISPAVQVLSDPEMGAHEVRVEARWLPQEAPSMEKTRELQPESDETETEVEAEVEDIVPRGHPFLILDGRRHVNLLRATVAIGRALDNDVILEDPRVSRHHAQLRRRYGRYVLYDLGSSRGTKINGYPIEECVLHAGDVISFAGVQIIYSEDPPTPIPLPGAEDTPALPAQETGSG